MPLFPTCSLDSVSPVTPSHSSPLGFATAIECSSYTDFPTYTTGNFYAIRTDLRRMNPFLMRIVMSKV